MESKAPTAVAPTTHRKLRLLHRLLGAATRVNGPAAALVNGSGSLMTTLLFHTVQESPRT